MFYGEIKMAIDKKLEIEVVVDGQKASVELRGLNDLFKGTGGLVDSIGSGLFKWSTGLNQASELAKKFFEVLRQPLQASADFEQYQVSLKVMLGDLELAKTRFKEMVQFAAVTPFNVPQVVEAGNKLQALGRYSQETLRMLGDLASASGKPIGQALEAYAHLVTGQNGIAIKMFRQLLIATDDWSRATGKAFTSMGRSTASTVELIEALSEIIKKKGFAGMMEEQSKTYLGRMSNMQDATQQLNAEIGDLFLDTAKSIVVGITNATQTIKANLGTIKAIFYDVILPVTSLFLAIKGYAVLTAVFESVKMALIGFSGAIISAGGVVELLKIKIASLYAVISAHPFMAIAIAITSVVVAMNTYNDLTQQTTEEKQKENEAQKNYLAGQEEEAKANLKTAERKEVLLEKYRQMQPVMEGAKNQTQEYKELLSELAGYYDGNSTATSVFTMSTNRLSAEINNAKRSVESYKMTLKTLEAQQKNNSIAAQQLAIDLAKEKILEMGEKQGQAWWKSILEIPLNLLNTVHEKIALAVNSVITNGDNENIFAEQIKKNERQAIENRKNRLYEPRGDLQTVLDIVDNGDGDIYKRTNDAITYARVLYDNAKITATTFNATLVELEKIRASKVKIEKKFPEGIGEILDKKIQELQNKFGKSDQYFKELQKIANQVSTSSNEVVFISSEGTPITSKDINEGMEKNKVLTTINTQMAQKEEERVKSKGKKGKSEESIKNKEFRAIEDDIKIEQTRLKQMVTDGLIDGETYLANLDKVQKKLEDYYVKWYDNKKVSRDEKNNAEVQADEAFVNAKSRLVEAYIKIEEKRQKTIDKNSKLNTADIGNIEAIKGYENILKDFSENAKKYGQDSKESVQSFIDGLKEKILEYKEDAKNKLTLHATIELENDVLSKMYKRYFSNISPIKIPFILKADETSIPFSIPNEKNIDTLKYLKSWYAQANGTNEAKHEMITEKISGIENPNEDKQKKLQERATEDENIRFLKEKLTNTKRMVEALSKPIIDQNTGKEDENTKNERITELEALYNTQILLEEKLTNATKAGEATRRKERMESIKQTIETIQNVTSQIAGIFSGIYNLSVQNGEREAKSYSDTANKKLDAEEKTALKFAKTEKQKSDIEQEYADKREAVQKEADKKKYEASKKWFYMDKAMKLAMAVENIALEISKSLATPWMIPIIAAAGAVEVATIMAQQMPAYKGGGYTGDGDPNKEAGVVHKGEFVMNAEKTKKYRPLLEFLSNEGIYTADNALNNTYTSRSRGTVNPYSGMNVQRIINSLTTKNSASDTDLLVNEIRLMRKDMVAYMEKHTVINVNKVTAEKIVNAGIGNTKKLMLKG